MAKRGNQPQKHHDGNLEAPRRRVKPLQEPVVPLTEGQKEYDRCIQDHKVVFGVGPAGTGKTWLATIRAAEALERGEINKIVVTRPIVEAEEQGLGFLPGELDQKYEPYLRPVREALEEYFGSGHLEYLLKSGIVEPLPLAFMRGATLKNCWVIADEMQNATVGQLKLLLTRFGEDAKFLITGDPDQVDIEPCKSGLAPVIDKLQQIPSIGAVHFNPDEIVRDGLVQEILEAL